MKKLLEIQELFIYKENLMLYQAQLNLPLRMDNGSLLQEQTFL